MQDVQGSVLGVAGRPTRNGRTVYDVQFSDGNKYSTFETSVATKAQGLVGQAVVARVEVKQNGQYTNYNLLDVAPVGSLPPLAMPAQAGTPIPIGPPIPIQQPQNNGGMSPERERKIVKQSCFATAYGFVGALFSGAGPEALAEAVEQADTLARGLFEQVFANPPEANHAPPSAVELAAQVNAAAGAPVVAVGAEAPPPAGSPVPAW